MASKYWHKFIIIGCACGMLAVAGCRPRGQKGNEIIQPEGVGNDIPLDERVYGGTPIKNADYASVQFAFDSYRVPDSEIRKIEYVANYMKRSREAYLVTEGHCDERGSRDYNISLGEHRALAVRAYLVGLGVDGSRIQTRSFGEEGPLDPGHNESAWRINRRVEFVLYLR